MPSLESLVASIPGLAGWEASRQAGQQQTSAQLAQASALMQLMQHAQQQQEAQRRIALDERFRNEINQPGADALAVARKYSPAKDVFHYELQSKDTQAKIDANKEAVMARLQQAAQQFESSWQLRYKSAATQEERLNLEKQREAFKQSLQSEAARLAGAKAAYEFGFQPAPAPTPNVSASALPSAEQAMKMFPAGRPLTVEIDPNSPEPATMPVAASPAAATAAPTQTSTAPPLPAMPPEIARAPKKVQDQWTLQQTKQSIAGSGTLSPDTLQFVAKQYLSGDRQAVQGFARSATARIAIQNAIVEEAQKQGLSPEATAAKIADFAGVLAGSRTVGQRAANISLAATEAEEMLGIVKETSDGFGRTNFVPWNMALKAYESGTGSPEIAKFGAAVNALVNVYARAINPTGVPTVSDKEHARAVLNTVQSPQQVDAVLGIIKRELEIAKKAPAQVSKGIQERVAPSRPSSNVDALLEKYK